MTIIRVLQSGRQLLVQDAGRPGRLALGVTESGFMDARSARLANRLVGNDPGCAVLESLLGEVELQVGDGDVWCAVTGADAPIAVVADGRTLAVSTNAPLHLPADSRLRIGFASRGMRCYLAFRGGVDVPKVLGSRSTDTLSSIGPTPIALGDEVMIGDDARELPHVDIAPVASPPAVGEVTRIGVTLGPRDDWLMVPDALFSTTWSVGSRQDRIGMQLDGSPLALAVRPALASEGTVAGAIEVPPDGRPYVLLRDHPVTVGYPVVAVVDPDGIDRLAQAAPGCLIRFVLSR